MPKQDHITHFMGCSSFNFCWINDDVELRFSLNCIDHFYTSIPKPLNADTLKAGHHQEKFERDTSLIRTLYLGPKSVHIFVYTYSKFNIRTTRGVLIKEVS